MQTYHSLLRGVDLDACLHRVYTNLEYNIDVELSKYYLHDCKIYSLICFRLILKPPVHQRNEPFTFVNVKQNKLHIISKPDYLRYRCYPGLAKQVYCAACPVHQRRYSPHKELHECHNTMDPTQSVRGST